MGRGGREAGKAGVSPPAAKGTLSPVTLATPGSQDVRWSERTSAESMRRMSSSKEVLGSRNVGKSPLWAAATQTPMSRQTESGRSSRSLWLEEADLTRFPMDRGRSWAVLAAGVFTFFVQLGFITSFGLYTDIISSEFHATEAEAGFAGGLAVGVMSMSPLIGSIVYKAFGSRICILIGSTWALLAFVSASYAQTLVQLYVSIFFIGLGFGFNVMSVCCIQVDYFDKYRLFALAFESLGSALGTTTMPHILLALTSSYGWRGSLFLLGGGCSYFYFVAAVMASRRPRVYNAPFRALLDVSILKRKTFLVVCFSCFLWGGASYSYFFFETKFMRFRGLTPEAAATVGSALGVSNIVGRLASSFLVQREATDRVLLNSLSCVLWSGAIALFCLPVSVGWLATVAALFGIGFGLMFPSLSPMLVEMFGVELITSSQSFAWLSLGLGSLFVPLITGKIADGTGDLRNLFYSLAAIGLSASLLTLAIAIHRSLRPPPPPLRRYSALTFLQELHHSTNSVSFA